jgi:membrane protease YdiL (CAAX protease family)
MAAMADVFKVILYVIASFVLAALITPHLYEIGKSFAHAALNRDTADRVVWLAAKADQADFPAYFRRSLFLSALVCLIPLFFSLDLRRHPGKRRSQPWSVGLSPNRIPTKMGQPLRRMRWGILHALGGFCLAVGLSLLMTWCLFRLNWFEWDGEPDQARLWKSFGSAIKPAIGIAVLEEFFFRGALMGIFLRAFRPTVAIVGLSLIFAGAHFLVPPADAVISDPRAAGAGFGMLTLIGQKFLQPETLIHSFISLFLAGVILGVARYGTASLWLPIGIHAGWIFAMKLFGSLAERRADFPDQFDLYMGREMTEGLLPIAVLMLTGIFVAVYLRLTQPRQAEGEPE